VSHKGETTIRVT